MAAGPLGSSGVRSQPRTKRPCCRSLSRPCRESNSLPSSCDGLAHRFGNAADGPDRTPSYGSDMTEAEWRVVRPLLLFRPGWRDAAGGRRALATSSTNFAPPLRSSERLRVDRQLEEGLTHGADPLHLALVLGIDEKTAIRYADSAHALLGDAAKQASQ